MSRPAPRQSGLAGRSPAQPPAPAPAPAVDAARTAADTATPRTPRAPRPTSTGGKEKVGFYQRTDDTARARAAFTWTRAQEGHRSFSDFVATALMREVDRLERKYNAGDAWTPMDAGEIPTGKPLGSSTTRP